MILTAVTTISNLFASRRSSALRPGSPRRTAKVGRPPLLSRPFRFDKRPIPEHWQVVIAAAAGGLTLLFGLWLLTAVNAIDWESYHAPRETVCRDQFGRRVDCD